jgi:uncharacterized protein YjdB
MVARRRRFENGARRILRAGMLALVLAPVACDGGPAGIGDGDVKIVEVAPEARSVVVGDTIRFTATARRADGSAVPAAQMAWSSGDTEVATLTGQGSTALVRAVGIGTVRISAAVGGRAGSVWLTVAEAPPVPATVTITPASPTVRVGGQLTLTAVLLTADGEVVEGHEITWSSQRPWLATIQAGDTNGKAVITGLQAGVATIVARGAGLENGIELAVTAAEPVAAYLEISPAALTVQEGDQGAVRAVLRAEDGTVIEGRPVTWSSQAPTTASVTAIDVPGHAVVSGHLAGSTTVVAQAEGLEASIPVAVTPRLTVSAMEMRPESLVVETGSTVTLRVHAWGADGSWIPDVPATWVSFSPTVVSVSGSGSSVQVTGLREGTAEIQAAAGGKVAKATLTVRNAAQVGYLIVTPRQVGLWERSAFRFTAAVLGPTGVELPGQPVAWAVEDPSVATIEADGLLMALRPGTTRVFARSGGKQGEAALRVYPIPGERMVFDLSPIEDPAGGGFRPQVALPSTTWTDPTGVTHTAHRYLVGGVMELARDGGSRWTQTLEVESLVILPTGSKVVARTTLADHGTFGFGWDDPWSFIYTSDETPGLRFESRMPEAGRMIVAQPIAGLPVMGYVWRMR